MDDLVRRMNEAAREGDDVLAQELADTIDRTHYREDHQVLKIRSRSIYGEAKVVDVTKDENTTLTSELTVLIQLRVPYIGQNNYEEIWDVKRPYRKPGFNDEYTGPETQGWYTYAEGFETPEAALEWMETNRDKWQS